MGGSQNGRLSPDAIYAAMWYSQQSMWPFVLLSSSRKIEWGVWLTNPAVTACRTVPQTLCEFCFNSRAKSLLVIGPCFANALKIGVNAPVSVRLFLGSPISHGNGGRKGLPSGPFLNACNLSNSSHFFASVICSLPQIWYSFCRNPLTKFFNSCLAIQRSFCEFGTGLFR